VDGKRYSNTGGGKGHLVLGSQGWQDLKAIFLWSQF
jgi:hypothetical protein